MSGPNPLAALAEALKALRPSALTEALIPPTFDWQTTEQYEDFHLFCRLMESWYCLQGMKEEPDDCARLEYLLNFLGTTGQQKHEQWKPEGATKLTMKIRRKVLLHSWNTPPQQWITPCPNDAGSINWRMSKYIQAKPLMSS